MSAKEHREEFAVKNRRRREGRDAAGNFVYREARALRRSFKDGAFGNLVGTDLYNQCVVGTIGVRRS